MINGNCINSIPTLSSLNEDLGFFNEDWESLMRIYWTNRSSRKFNCFRLIYIERPVIGASFVLFVHTERLEVDHDPETYVVAKNKSWSAHSLWKHQD